MQNYFKFSSILRHRSFSHICLDILSFALKHIWVTDGQNGQGLGHDEKYLQFTKLRQPERNKTKGRKKHSPRTYCQRQQRDLIE